MKLNNLVKVNIDISPTDANLAYTQHERVAVIFVYDASLPTAINTLTTATWYNLADIGDAAKEFYLAQFVNLFATYGGQASAIQIAFVSSDITEATLKTLCSKLPLAIINIQVLYEHTKQATNSLLSASTPVTEAAVLAIAKTIANVTNVDIQAGRYTADRKLVYLAISENAAITDYASVLNLVLLKHSGVVRPYLTAMMLGYYAAITNNTSVISDIVYTKWLGNESAFTIDEYTESVTGYNFFTNLANSIILYGGVTASKLRLHVAYFEIAIAQDIVSVLLEYTLAKHALDSTIYSGLYNVLTLTLDKYVDNGILEQNFVNTNYARTVNRLGINYDVLVLNEVFTYGYKVITLPILSTERTSGTYEGLIVYLAIGKQLLGITMNGLIVGGI